MKTNYIQLICTLLIPFSIFSQDKNLKTKYTNYFQNTREIPYLHLNKTTFLKGEEIWFQAYVIEQNSNKLHKTTSNLYVSIFNEYGKLKQQHLIHVKNGVGKGNFLIDSTFTKNNYYIKASTNWMKNFNEDNSYTQKIGVINSTKSNKSTVLSENKFFEFKLFPEGGYPLINRLNTIGILIKNNKNKGIKISKGIIKNRNKEIIGEFSTNKFGLGKSSLFFTENDFYTFEAELPNGTTLKKSITKLRKTGIILKTKNNEQFLNLTVSTNKKSLKILENKKYRIFIHNTKSFKNYFFNFNNKDVNYTLNIHKNVLEGGINIITLFNDQNKPVLEKLIFNETDNLYANIKINHNKIVNDSLLISIENKNSESINLSASFLPSNTKAYNSKRNITSTILLKPYIKGYIENPAYYFNKKNKKRLRDLELLFLTQGWSKYNWDNIFSEPKKQLFSFENGIKITATLNKKLREKQSIILYSKDNNLVRDIKPNENPFILENTYIKKNSKINFALRTNDNLYKISPVLSFSKWQLAETINVKNFQKFDVFELSVKDLKNLAKDVQLLDEIVIKSNKRKYENKVYGMTTMLTGFKTENLMIPSGEKIIDFLLFKGYEFTNGILRKRSSRTSIRRKIDENPNMDPLIRQRREVRVYLDGYEITGDLYILFETFTDTLKEIYYGRDPGQFSEFIHLYSLTAIEYANKKAKFNVVKLPAGFATPKKYYTPKYPSFLDNNFKNYGLVFWKPSIIISANSKTSFKIPANQQKELKIFVEGISNSGKLLSQKEIVKTD